MPKLVSMREAVAILGVAETTVRNWNNQGLIEAKRTLGGHRRFDLHSLKTVYSRFAAEREVSEENKIRPDTGSSSSANRLDR